MKTKKLGLVTCVITAFASTAQDKPVAPTISGLYDVGGFKLYLECYQNNKPTLVIESGFGLWGSDGVWQKQLASLETTYSVCLYDRAGLGKSEQGPVPFTVNDAATRLNNLLSAANIKAPYYFAAHSYGGYIVTAYNNLFSDNVAGAVLIDPTFLGYFHAMGTRWPKDFKTDNKQLARLHSFESSVHNPLFEKVPEKVDHMKSYQQLVGHKDFAAKPIITIRTKSANEPFDPPFVPQHVADVMTKLVNNSHRYFESLSSNNQVIYSKSDKHFLHLHDPELVIKSILQLAQMETRN